MAAWGLAWDAIRTVPPAELASLAEGVDWTDEPFLVADGAAIYVVDRAEPEPVIPLDDAAVGRDAGPSQRRDASVGPHREGDVEGRHALSSGCSIGGRDTGPELPALLIGLALLLRRRRA
jgi:uncharacterized protein (TIGR03382 family)